MSNKSKMVISVIGFILSIVLMIVIAVLAENARISFMAGTILIVLALIPVFITTFFILKIDYETGVYECRNCGHIFKPTAKAYIFGAHTPTKRCLACPECGTKTWCIRRHKEN